MARNLKSTVRTMERRKCLRSVLAGLTTFSILSVTALSQCLAAGIPPAFDGTLSVRGMVNVNGLRATEGQTLFAKTNVSTGVNSESLITLGNHSRLNLSAKSELTIESFDKRVLG